MNSSYLPSSFWDLPLSNNSLTVDDRVTFIVETTQFVIFCITMTIYLSIVSALIEAQRKKVDELNSPFFKLCLSTAGVDIWTLLTNYFGAMFAKWGWTAYWSCYFSQRSPAVSEWQKRNSSQIFELEPTPAIMRSRTKERAKMREARLFTMSTIIVGVQLCILILFIFKGADILAFTTDQFYLVYNAVR
ncbi:unnamed protein product [Caenorhabditis brenneri]